MMIMTIFDQNFFLLQKCNFGAKIPKKCKNKNFPLILNIFMGVLKIQQLSEFLVYGEQLQAPIPTTNRVQRFTRSSRTGGTR